MTDNLTGKNISRRKVLQTSLVAGGALATPYFFMRSAKADSKQLNIYNWDGNLGDFYVEHWKKCKRKSMPNVQNQTFFRYTPTSTSTQSVTICSWK